MEPLACVTFDAEIIQWRGPAPYLFACVPDAYFGEIKYAAQLASYGWGVVPVVATIGTTEFTTSLFPRDGCYLLPIKGAVQRAEGLALGDKIHATIRVIAR
jgi:Domain of unknown function (DUF1905)